MSSILFELIKLIRTEFADAFTYIKYTEGNYWNQAVWQGGDIVLDSLIINSPTLDDQMKIIEENEARIIVSSKSIENLQSMRNIELMRLTTSSVMEEILVSENYGRYEMNERNSIMNIRDILSTYCALVAEKYRINTIPLEKYIGGLLHLQPFSATIHTIEGENNMIVAMGVSYNITIENKEYMVIEDVASDKMNAREYLTYLIQRMLCLNRGKPALYLHKAERPFIDILTNFGFETTEKYHIYKLSEL